MAAAEQEASSAPPPPPPLQPLPLLVDLAAVPEALVEMSRPKDADAFTVSAGADPNHGSVNADCADVACDCCSIS
jgi:hypothetical protein